VALHKCNSGAESGRELLKGSKDAVSLLFRARKKLFWLVSVDFFVSDVINGGLLGRLGSLHLALGPNR